MYPPSGFHRWALPSSRGYVFHKSGTLRNLAAAADGAGEMPQWLGVLAALPETKVHVSALT